MSDTPVHPGDILAGKYRVDRVLGQGSMGVVVAATHVELGQHVALKFLLQGACADKAQRERFLREARAAGRLKSHHLARVTDVGTLENESPYIVMEFLEGGDLAALLMAKGRLPIDEAVEYVLQACEAVGEAHAAGIVHRDLKPANLFLTEDVGGAPSIKVLDFGVSKFSGDLTLTQDAQALGSPLYMSPEQMNSSKNVDGRSDLWSLGVVLYQLVTGWTPFHADTIQQLCGRVLFGQPTPLNAYRTGAPPGFEAVILRCLQRDREQRFRDVAELAAALAPYAPDRARVYVERVGRVVGTLDGQLRASRASSTNEAGAARPVDGRPSLGDDAPSAMAASLNASSPSQALPTKPWVRVPLILGALFAFAVLAAVFIFVAFHPSWPPAELTSAASLNASVATVSGSGDLSGSAPTVTPATSGELSPTSASPSAAVSAASSAGTAAKPPLAGGLHGSTASAVAQPPAKPGAASKAPPVSYDDR